MNQKKFVLLLVIVAVASLLFGSFLLPAPSLKENAAAVEQSGVYVYEKLSQVYAPLSDYAESHDLHQLQLARETLGKAAAVCVSYRDFYGYRASDDQTSDINQAWCVSFMVWAYDQLGSFDTTLNPQQEESLAVMLKVFLPDSPSGGLDFMTMFSHAADPTVLNCSQLTGLITYDTDNHLVLPAF